MHRDERYEVLDDAARLARGFIDGLPNRRVGESEGLEELRARLARPLPEGGLDAREVIEELARDVDPGLVASAGPRYFGFVIGGALPASVAADWLTSTWDQNAGGFTPAPSLSVVEEVAATWVRDILGLPSDCGLGFVTGCQMAHFTCLAAARHAVLRDVGWDVEAHGLPGAPPVRVLAGEHCHITVKVACRMLGLGERVDLIEADERGRMAPEKLEEALASAEGPAIVCAQAGEINTGAFDPFPQIVAACREAGAWCHVDGAFGLWAAASPNRRHLIEGFERADSWATDGHKWLNVPYDCGIAAVADAAAHKSAMTSSSAYIPPHDDDVPWGYDWTPEFSRRARGVPVYAALRSLGRKGVAELVDRCCEHARTIAARLGDAEGVEVLNEVELNQVLVRIDDDDETTARTVEFVQNDGTCWLSGSTFRGNGVMRISVVGWRTQDSDAELSADAILRAAEAARNPSSGR